MKRAILLAMCVTAMVACWSGQEPPVESEAQPVATSTPAPDVVIEAVGCIERCTATCDRKCCTHHYWGKRAEDGSCRPCYGPSNKWDCTTTIVCHKDLPECNVACCPACPQVSGGCQIS